MLPRREATNSSPASQKMINTGMAAAFEEGHSAEHPLPVPAARAYVTLVARVRAGYGGFQELAAVVRLARALREAGAAYPLVVAVPPDAPDNLRHRLAREGCVVREVYPLNYVQPGHLATGCYGGGDADDDTNYHSKLCRFFQFLEYERVVYVDAARIRELENMDDLFELDKGFLYAWMESSSSADDKAWSSDPPYKIAYINEESPDMVAWRAVDAELALLCKAAVIVHEPGMPFGGALLGKNRAAELGELYCNTAGFAPREPGATFGEALLGKNLAAVLGAPYANAPMSTSDPGMPLGEALVGENCAAGLDAPYSNAAVLAHQLGMNAGVAPRALPASSYTLQVVIDKAIGAKAGGPIAVLVKASGADAGDARGRAGKLAVVGIVAASSAVTAVSAGAVSPAVAFGSFLVLLGGLSVAMSTVRGA